VCPWQLLAAFLGPMRVVCNSLRHVALPADGFRDDATGLDVLKANVRCVTRAARGPEILLTAVAMHFIGAAIGVLMLETV